MANLVLNTPTDPGTSAWTDLALLGVTPEAFTALGDLLAGTGASSYGVLTVGADGQVLIADSGEVTGLRWGAAPATAPSVVATAADPYAVLAADEYVLLTGTAQVVNLPAGATHNTGVVTIKDKAGTATASPITVNANGAETIDGAGFLSLDSNYAAVTLVFDGTEWSIV